MHFCPTHLRLTVIKSGRNGARSVTNNKRRPLDPPVAAFPVLHVVDVVPQPSAFEVTAINSHPTQLNLSWRDWIVVVVFDRLPKKESVPRALRIQQHIIYPHLDVTIIDFRFHQEQSESGIHFLNTSSVLQLLKHSKIPLLLSEVGHWVHPEELDNN